MKQILLIVVGLSAFIFADFTKNGDIVTDTTTGLLWQDNTDTKTVKKSWIEAVDYCENLTLGGYSDWRLPNINEFKSIVDRSKSNPAIVDGFTNVRSDFYWSSTTTASASYDAWNVHFCYGNVTIHSKTHSYCVRCVRARQVDDSIMMPIFSESKVLKGVVLY